jgi:hypothetical protein
MSKVIVFGVPHEVQGTKFQQSIDDKCYRDTVEHLTSVYRFDFIFEEAAGYSPSHAEIFAAAQPKPICYLNVDPSREEREKYELAAETGASMVVDLWQVPPCILHTQFVAAHEAREEFWLKRIREKDFSSALMICGEGHGLSFSFRLRTAGYEVENCINYLPYDILCRHAKAARDAARQANTPSAQNSE